MRFQELIREYNHRKNTYNRPDKEQLIFKAYDRFRRGIEVRFGDLQESKNILLNDILIKIPQIELVKAKVDTLLTEIKSSNGMGIQVIYGEYGQGKSQIAQILEETYSNYNHYPNMLYYYHKLTTFENFMKDFSVIIRERFEKSPGLINIEKKLEKIENALRKNDLPTNKIIDIFIEVINESTRQGRPLLMIFDEIDTILTTPEEFKPWGDLLVRLNDSEDLMMILIFLMPKAIGDKLKNIDNRLQRFNLWMGVKSVTLSGSYQNLITSVSYC